MPALLFGSISTLADTSEEQRSAFNEAFAAHGLDWRWEVEEYRELLTSNGGQDRIASYAAARHQDVDAAAVHNTKSEIFQRKLVEVPLQPRPGVTESVAAARENGWRLALVTTTSADNVSALLDALSKRLPRDSFDTIVDSTVVDESKPAPAAYLYALERLGLDSGDCIAVEDNVGGAQSAAAAGIMCVAFPNENTVTHDFGSTPITRRLNFAELSAAVAAR